MDFDEVFFKGKEGAESISKCIFLIYVVYYGTSNEIFWIWFVALQRLFS